MNFHINLHLNFHLNLHINQHLNYQINQYMNHSLYVLLYYHLHFPAYIQMSHLDHIYLPNIHHALIYQVQSHAHPHFLQPLLSSEAVYQVSHRVLFYSFFSLHALPASHIFPEALPLFHDAVSQDILPVFLHLHHHTYHDPQDAHLNVPCKYHNPVLQPSSYVNHSF